MYVMNSVLVVSSVYNYFTIISWILLYKELATEIHFPNVAGYEFVKERYKLFSSFIFIAAIFYNTVIKLTDAKRHTFVIVSVSRL